MSGTPRRRRRRARRPWKSGKSIRIAAAGDRLRAAESSAASARRSPGIFSNTSATPKTASESDDTIRWSPAASIREPPIPKA
jgi:hypothetical protein